MVDEYKDRLQSAMRLAGVTEDQLARLLGVTPQAVTKVVKGASKSFSAPNNTLAARFLGVDSDWLATGDGSSQSRAPKLQLTEHERAVILALRSSVQNSHTSAHTSGTPAVEEQTGGVHEIERSTKEASGWKRTQSGRSREAQEQTAPAARRRRKIDGQSA